jgi:hypothetical protein
VVGGSVIVDKGQIKTVDLPRLIEAHNREAGQLLLG